MVAALLFSFTAAACSDDETGDASSFGTGGGGQASAGSLSGSGAASGSEVGSTGSTGAATGSTGASGGGSPGPLAGYWVWTRQIENDQVILEITDADMEPKVGSAGWPQCPDGILCTHYGIQKVAFGATGRLHYQLNVFTSSDFQTLGTWSEGTEGHGTFERQEQLSCAHPEQVNADVVGGGFRHQMVGGELRIGVPDFGSSFPFYDDGNEPARWISYKPVSREDYYGKYMIRVCQPHDGYECHEACFDESLVDEP
jgi:hypothetical protein